MERRRPWLAGLVGSVGLAFAPEGHCQASPEGAPPEPAAAGWTALFRNVAFTLGPVRWKGELTTEYRHQRLADQPAPGGFVQSGNVALASYVHQPWFAQVGGNLGFAWSGVTDGGSFGLTGGAHLAVFPLSRFPFEATLNVSDTRASEDNLGADYRNILLGVKQSYKFSNEEVVAGRLEHSSISGAQVGNDTLDVGALTYSLRRGDHRIFADGFWSVNSGAQTTASTEIRRLNGQHAYTPADNLNVDTIATYNWQESRPRQGGLGGNLGGRFAQLASFATWRPDEDHRLYSPDHPLLVTAAARLTATGFDVGESSSDAIGLSGAAGASYVVNPATRLSAAGSLTLTNSDSAADGLSASLSAGVSYDPPPIRWKGFGYTWRLSGGASSVSGPEIDRHGVFAQGNHQVSREVAFTDRSRLTMSIGQGLGVNATTEERGVSVSHSAQATWALQGDAGWHGYTSIGASDARNYGTPESSFQLVNLQLTSQAQVNALSHLAASLTVQGSRQRGEPSATARTTSFDSGFNVTTSGSLSYQHQRAFGVARLRFIAAYTANPPRLQTSRAEGNLAAPLQQTGDALDVRFEYRIGKLDTRLVFRSAELDGRRGTGIFFRATRYF